ncbi:MAG: DNA replication/repair protein RecF [Candidatus Porifericomitaceae bacterium WSBS_2022_MAG_OTU9]
MNLEVNSVRNLSKVNIEASPGLNLLVGPNGSGKSSLIESICLISRGRSFRTRKISQVLQSGKKGMHVAADFYSSRKSCRIRVGMERGVDGTRLRLSGRNIKSSSELSMEVPIVLITPDGHSLLEGGPMQRRRWTDMGVFHMKQDHLQRCINYTTALRNRNHLLRRQGCDLHQLSAWEKQMGEFAEPITEAREQYIERIESEAAILLKEFGFNEKITILFKRGWLDGVGFTETLEKNRGRDIQMQYTKDGPHVADLVFYVDGVDAGGYLSRGRQKILFTALAMAAAKTISSDLEPPVLLVDDLVADLDEYNVHKVFEVMSSLGCQAWVTATDFGNDVPGAWPQKSRFHVERGNISPH